MKIQVLKTVNPWFNLVWNKEKSFEIRENDRDFQTSDLIILREYDDKYEEYSCRTIIFNPSFIMFDYHFSGLKEGYCVLGIKDQINTVYTASQFKEIVIDLGDSKVSTLL